MLRQSGASIPPETMMHFLPVSDFPLIFETFSDFVENFLNFTFSRKISSLTSAKISDDPFFSRRPQIPQFPPIFPVSAHFPLFCENYCLSPYFSKFPPVSETLTCFLHTFYAFRFPPNLTMMHHPMHVLDASENIIIRPSTYP